MRNRPGFVGLEGTDDLESLGQNADTAILAGEEEVIRPRTYTAYIVTLATSAMKQNVSDTELD